MNHVALEQMEERTEGPISRLDVLPLTGTWVNTNPSPMLISRIEFEAVNNQLRMRVQGAGPDLPSDWGEVEALPFAELTTSLAAIAISARFDFGRTDVLLQGYVVKGVLVIVGFTRRKNSRSSSSFGKEFFYRIQ